MEFKSDSRTDKHRQTDRHLTEVQHGGGIGVGSMVGQQADLSLSLLLLDSQFGSTVSVSTTTAEQDEDGPQQPEP